MSTVECHYLMPTYGRGRGLGCKDGVPRLREQVRMDDDGRGIEPCLVGSRLGGRVRPPVLPSSSSHTGLLRPRDGEGASSLLPSPRAGLDPEARPSTCTQVQRRVTCEPTPPKRS